MNNHFGNDSVPLSTSGLTQHELDQIANIGSCYSIKPSMDKLVDSEPTDQHQQPVPGEQDNN